MSQRPANLCKPDPHDIPVKPEEMHIQKQVRCSQDMSGKVQGRTNISMSFQKINKRRDRLIEFIRRQGYVGYFIQSLTVFSRKLGYCPDMRIYLAVQNKAVIQRAKPFFTIEPEHTCSAIQYHPLCVLRTVHFCSHQLSD